MVEARLDLGARTGAKRGVVSWLVIGCLLAGNVTFSSVCAAGSTLLTASDAEKAEAGKRFAAGMQAMDKQDFARAETEFRASYASVSSPNSQLMLGRALSKLGRLGEAYEAFEASEAEASELAKTEARYTETAAAAARERRELEPKVGFVSVRVENPQAATSLSVAGRELPKERWGQRVAVTPGSVTVELSSGGKTQQQKLEVAAGSSESLELGEAPEQAAPSGSTGSTELDGNDVSLRTWAYVAGGVGVAGLFTFGVFGALNNSKFSDLEDSCAQGSCPPDRESDADTGRTYQTVANVGLVLGVVGLGAGAALFFLSSGEEKSAKAGKPRTRVGLGPGSVQVVGSF